VQWWTTLDIGGITVTAGQGATDVVERLALSSPVRAVLLTFC